LAKNSMTYFMDGPLSEASSTYLLQNCLPDWNLNLGLIMGELCWIYLEPMVLQSTCPAAMSCVRYGLNLSV